MRRYKKIGCAFAQAAHDRAKKEICRELQRSILRHQWTQRWAAFHLRTSQSAISDIFNSRVDRLSFNQLLRYLAIAEPFFRIMIAN